MLSSHILDTCRGRPACGVKVIYFCDDLLEGEGVTNEDGRINDLTQGKPLQVGLKHRLKFEVHEYFRNQSVEAFFVEINVDFIVNDSSINHHIPLILSPFSYTTYRGS